MICIHCGASLEEVPFVYGRPRKDGTQHPVRYCAACLTLPERKGGGREAHRRAARESARRRRAAA